MNVLAGIAGSGAGIVTIAVAWLIDRHQYRVPLVSAWLARLAAILMFAGGSAVAVTPLGQWIVTMADGAAQVLGGLGSGLPFAVLTVAALFLAVGVTTDLIWAPGSGLITAAVLPLILGLTQGGLLHGMYEALAIPAGQYAAAISALIGG